MLAHLAQLLELLNGALHLSAIPRRVSGEALEGRP
jgi:hypothetical protein